MTHVIAAHKSDGATSGPVLLAIVAEGPCLFEDMVGGEDSTIRDGLANEYTLEFRLGGRDGLGSSRFLFNFLLYLRLGGLDGNLGWNRFSWLDINNSADRVDGVAGNRGFSLSRLGRALVVTHFRHILAVLVLASCCNTDMADRSLELNQGMSLVVSVNGTGLAVGTEV
jgi:hypothetical protein